MIRYQTINLTKVIRGYTESLTRSQFTRTWRRTWQGNLFWRKEWKLPRLCRAKLHAYKLSAGYMKGSLNLHLNSELALKIKLKHSKRQLRTGWDEKWIQDSPSALISSKETKQLRPNLIGVEENSRRRWLVKHLYGRKCVL